MTTWDEPVTFADVWCRAVRANPSGTFLIFEGPDGFVRSWTYAEFDAVVGRSAHLLDSHGVAPGSSVHLALTNCPSFVAVWLAATRLGAWIVPVDPNGRAPEFADQIARVDPVLGVCGTGRVKTYEQALGDRPLIVIDEATDDLGWHGPAEMTSWPSPALTDTCAVMFTSGTTGRPKGVEITQANYAFAGKIMAGAASLTADDRQLVVLPLFHANAQYYSFASAIWAGASVALMHTFSASGFLPAAARHQATCASLFAAPMRMILARGRRHEGVRLRHCWYAQNLTDDQIETLTEWFGCRPRQLYGMTETIAAVLSDTSAVPRHDSIGFTTPGCTVDLHDRLGHAVHDGEIGNIVVGGQRGVTLFAGYLDDPNVTASSFRDGWFQTGDRARRDPEGRWYFQGRQSDILKVGGENVSTVEVEAVLSAHPKVLEATVVGAPDDVYDEIPVAYVVAADAHEPPIESELVDWCTARLAKSKVPRTFTMLDELPRTSVGKIRKFMLPRPIE